MFGTNTRNKMMLEVQTKSSLEHSFKKNCPEESKKYQISLLK
jgi:hypothetical protein